MLNAQLYRHAEDLVKLNDRNRAIGRKLVEVIQELPALRARRALYDALLEDCAGVHLITDHAGRILAASGAPGLLGDPAALAGHSLQDLTATPHIARLEALLGAHQHGVMANGIDQLNMHAPGTDGPARTCRVQHLSEVAQDGTAHLHWQVRAAAALPAADEASAEAGA